MTTAEHSEEIDRPRARVWEALAAFHQIDRYHPRVATVDPLSAHEHGMGAVRRCNFNDGSSVVETVVDWQEGSSLRVELSDFSMPLRRATAEFRVAELSPTRCRVTITMDFTPKFGVFGKLMGAMMMRPMMRRMFSEVLDGLRGYVTDEPSDELAHPSATP